MEKRKVGRPAGSKMDPALKKKQVTVTLSPELHAYVWRDGRPTKEIAEAIRLKIALDASRGTP